MQSVVVVLDSVTLYLSVGQLNPGEQIKIQELIPEPAVEKSHEWVLPEQARWNVSRASALTVHKSKKAEW